MATSDTGAVQFRAEGVSPPSLARHRLVIGSTIGALLAIAWQLRLEFEPAAYGAQNPKSDAKSVPAGQSSPRTARPTRPLFVNVAELIGADFVYYSDGRTDRFFLPEIMGGGAAWIDFDGDGWLDLFVVQGCEIAELEGDTNHRGVLFRSGAAGGRFTEVGESAGAIDHGYGQGVCVGDVDNDGFPDLYVTHYGGNRLLMNHGDGTFSDATDHASVRSGGWSTSCAFGDLDRDGDLDLYVTHYVQTTVENNPNCSYTGPAGNRVRGYCGPSSYKGEPDELFANQGDGRFENETEASGAAVPGGKGLAVVVADLNNDGWPDIYVANDMEYNFLLWNESGATGTPTSTTLRLRDDGLASGAGLTSRGDLGASMGIGCADFDHNGYLDLVVSNYLNQGVNLYVNQSGAFSDQSSGAQLYTPTLPYLGFGVVFLDYDNDGWADVFITNGHVLGPLVGPPDRMRGQLFQNGRNGRFVEVTERAGPYFYKRFFGRGVAIGDFTNSGATSLAVVHQNDPMAVLRNDTPNRGHYVGLHLVGTRSNRCALNARVTIEVAGEQYMLENAGGGSYLSDSDHRILAGIGPNRRVDRVEIRWPSGTVDEFHDLAADRYWYVHEGQSPRVVTNK